MKKFFLTLVLVSGTAFTAFAKNEITITNCTREKARAVALEYINGATELAPLSDEERDQLRNVLAPLADIAGCN
jgi:hypothetical protein